MLSSVVLAPNFIPLHSLKKNATAYLSSMRARWIPTHEREPAPNGWKAVRASGLPASAGAEVSFEGIQREVENLWLRVLVRPCDVSS